MSEDGHHGRKRRQFLAAAAGTGTAALAGCTGLLDRDGGGTANLSEFRGSGTLVEGRPEPGGTPISELPDLSGSLALYLGGGEGGAYRELFDLIEAQYPDFQLSIDGGPSSQLAQTIVDEHESGALRGDVFLPIDAGALGYVADAGATTSLPEDVTSLVPSTFRGDGRQWVGLAGRARAVPFNTDTLSKDDIPEAVAAFPDTPALADGMGWAPTYGAFQSFVTAMRLLRGPGPTKQWLNDMQAAGVSRYNNEYVVTSRVADGELAAGFANHYYAIRVMNQRPDAPLDLAFTRDDAGAIVNCAGAALLSGAPEELATTFVRHLLSAEAQEYFATVANGYPLVEGVGPLASLPPIQELNPPDLALPKLGNLEPTLELMREVGVL